MTPRYSAALRVLDAYEPSLPCSCDECKVMCRRPCWPTPAEAEALMDAGHGRRLMADEWSGDDPITVLAPASPGHEGCGAPLWPVSGCVLQDEDGLCGLHAAGLKPLEGRVAHHADTSTGLHQAIAKCWDTDEGRAAVRRWEEECGGRAESPFSMPGELYGLLRGLL